MRGILIRNVNSLEPNAVGALGLRYGQATLMYMFWHALFSFVLAVLLYRLAKPNLAWLYLLATVSAGVLPDVDHLLSWNPAYLAHLFPRYLGEGLTLGLRTSVYPCILHLWLWPLFLLSIVILKRGGKLHPYLFAVAAGWALHLALDGVLVII